MMTPNGKSAIFQVKFRFPKRKDFKAKGMSQEVLSGFAGIARTHLTMIECGTKQANFSTICKIAEAFDMRPSELVRKMEEAEEKRDK